MVLLFKIYRVGRKTVVWAKFRRIKKIKFNNKSWTLIANDYGFKKRSLIKK